MFEYLPEEEAVNCDYKEKNDKKPLLVRLAIFRLVLALAVLAAMLLFRGICPQETEKVSEEFRTSTGSSTEADDLISEAAKWFMSFIEQLPSESRA